MYLLKQNHLFPFPYQNKNQTKLNQLTGFSGSTAICITNNNINNLFVDGRYEIQAGIETNSNKTKVHKIADLIDFLKGLNGEIYFDPWCHTINEINKLQEKNTNIKFKIGENSINNFNKHIDESFFENKYYQYPKKFHGTNYIDKIRNLNKNNLFITSQSHSNWLLNLRGNDALYTPIAFIYILIYKTNIYVFCHKKNITQDLSEQYNEINFCDFSEMINLLTNIDEQIEMDPKTAPFAFTNIIKNKNYTACELELQSSIKNGTEICNIKKAHEFDCISIIKLFNWIDQSKKISEIDISNQLELIKKQHSTYIAKSFETIVGSGPNSAIIHYNPNQNTNRIIQDNDILLIDSGSQYLNGTTDVTRTIFIGNPSIKQKNLFTYVLKGHMALCSQIFPIGTTGSNLDILARQFLYNNFLDYNHGTGHSVGHFLGVHDGICFINKKNNQELIDGMVLSIEPGVYIENEFGIRLENLYLCKKTEHSNFLCFECLTFAPFDLSLINFDLLYDSETKWLLNYHKKILEILQDNTTKKWFKNKYIEPLLVTILG